MASAGRHQAGSPAALVDAAARGDVRAIEALVGVGADVNAAAPGGETPLHAACEQDQLGAVKALLDAGADPDVKDARGSTCLHNAVATGGAAEAEMLLDGGADLALVDARGRTALQLAAEGRQGHIVDLLLARGADARGLGAARSTPAIEAKLREAAARPPASTSAAARPRRQRGDAFAPSARAGLGTANALPADRRRSRRARADGPPPAEEPGGGYEVIETDGRPSSRRRRRPPADDGEGARHRGGTSVRGPPRGAHDGDDTETVRYDMVLVYPRKPSSAPRKPPQPRAPQRAALVKRLRACGLAVKRSSAHEENGDDKVLIVVGATRARLMRAAEESRMRLRLRAEFGGGFAPFSAAFAHAFEPPLHLTRVAPAGGGEDARAHFDFGSAERAALLNLVLAQHHSEGGAGIDLGEAYRRTDLERVFLLHDDAERLALEAQIGDGSLIGADPLPLRTIEAYLGPEYAFYFAFLHRLNRALWLPVALGVVLFAVEQGVGGAPGASGADWLTPAYALVLMVWSTGFVETWKRRQNALAAEWDSTAKLTRSTVRAEFQGQYRRGLYSPSGDFVPILPDELPADAEAPLLEMVPSELPRRRVFASSCVLACFLGATIIGTLGLLVFRFVAAELAGVGGTFGAALVMAVFVEVMSYVYDAVAHRLTAWENHRSYDDHRNSLIVKLFVFSFFNKYFNLFWLAFGKGRRAFLFGGAYSEPCVDWAGEESDSCLGELRTQVLVMVAVHATVSQFVESALPYVQYMRARAADARRALAGQPREPRAVRQLRLVATAPLFAEYNELILDFAVCTLFATAFPLAPLVVLLNNFVEMRLDLLKVLRLRERPLIHAVDGIGLWLPLFDAVGYLAVFTNLAILAFTSNHVDRLVSLSDSAKFLVLVGVEHAVLIAKAGLSFAVPDVPARVLNAMTRRDFLAAVWIGGERVRPQVDHIADGTASAADEPDDASEATDDADERLCAQAEAEHASALARAPRSPSAGAMSRRAAPSARRRGAARSPPPPTTSSSRRAPSPDARFVRAADSPRSARAPSPDARFVRAADSPRSARASSPPHADAYGFTQAAARVRASGVAWAPARALAARRAPRQCTDVLCTLAALAVLGGLVALSSVGFSIGDPTRLASPLDHGFDACGQPAVRHPAPLDARLIERGGGARLAPFTPAGRDRIATPFLFFADPQAHLGICVRACPAPADSTDGFSARALVCTDACAALSESERAERLGRCCFPAYATFDDGGGYCRPADSVSASSLAAAFDKADLRYTDADGASRRAPRFFPSDVGLAAVRDALDAPARDFARIAADVRAVSTVTIACTCGALAVSLLLAAAFATAPIGTVVCAFFLSLVGLAALTGVLWASGEAAMREHVARPLSVEFRAGYALAVTGYVCCALTIIAFLACVYASSTLFGRIGELTRELNKVIERAPALRALPLFGVLASVLVLVWWFFLALHLASAGQLRISERGHPLATHDSAAVRLLTVHALLGAALLLAVQHAARLVASGVATVYYFRKGVASIDLPAAPANGPSASAAAAASAADGADGKGGRARDDAPPPARLVRLGAASADADGEYGQLLAHADDTRPLGMSRAAVVRAPRPFDMSAQRMTTAMLNVSSIAWLALRYHVGSVLFGAVLCALLWPVRFAFWFLRPCRFNARPADDDGAPDRVERAHALWWLLDWVFAVSADAYAHVVALDRNLAPAMRTAWRELLAQPGSVALAQQTAEICFFALKFAVGCLAAGAAGVALSLSAHDGALGRVTSILYPMSYAFVLAYLTATHFVLIYEAVLAGLSASFCMDTTRNPPELWSMSSALLRVLGGAALASRHAHSVDDDDDEGGDEGDGGDSSVAGGADVEANRRGRTMAAQRRRNGGRVAPPAAGTAPRTYAGQRDERDVDSAPAEYYDEDGEELPAWASSPSVGATTTPQFVDASSAQSGAADTRRSRSRRRAPTTS